jgi:hypothetical protein
MKREQKRIHTEEKRNDRKEGTSKRGNSIPSREKDNY